MYVGEPGQITFREWEGPVPLHFGVHCLPCSIQMGYVFKGPQRDPWVKKIRLSIAWNRYRKRRQNFSRISGKNTVRMGSSLRRKIRKILFIMPPLGDCFDVFPPAFLKKFHRLQTRSVPRDVHRDHIDSLNSRPTRGPFRLAVRNHGGHFVWPYFSYLPKSPTYVAFPTTCPSIAFKRSARADPAGRSSFASRA